MGHKYSSSIVWTGNLGKGTAGYRVYERTWDVAIPGKLPIHCSNDPLLGGDAAKMNPEDLLISALSACHMLWYLHYASDAGIVVTTYEDRPVGYGEVLKSGAGRFTAAVLRPRITVQSHTDLKVAKEIHHRIQEVCFVARSVNFPISYEPMFLLSEANDS